MSTKRFIYICLFIFSCIGGWLSSLVDHSLFSVWGIVGGSLGSFFGIRIGYKLGNN